MVSSIFRPWDTTSNEQTIAKVDMAVIDRTAVPKSEHCCSELTSSDYENSSGKMPTSTLPSASVFSGVATTDNEANCHANDSTVDPKNCKPNAVSMPAIGSMPILSDPHPYRVSRQTNIFSCSNSNSSNSSRQSSPDMQTFVPEMSNISRPSISFSHGPPQTSLQFGGSPYMQPQQMVSYSMRPFDANGSWTEQHEIAATHQLVSLSNMPLDLFAMEKIRQDYVRVLAEDLRAKNSNKRKDRPKNHRCSFSPCAAAFSNAAQLRGHHRIHTGERPYKCDHEGCDKSFTRNEELTRHKRIHTGVKPYGCELCGKSFGRRDHLKKHGKTHEERQQIMMMPFNPYYYSRYF